MRFIAIGIEALNEARGLLFEIGRGEIEAHQSHRRARCARPRFNFCSSMPELSRQPPSCVATHDAADIGRLALVAQPELAAIVLIRPAFEREAASRQIRRAAAGMTLIGAMHRARAVNDAGRAAQHFDRAGLLAVHFEQLVDVAEADRPDRHAVLEKQKHAARARPAQHRRADRGQAFLAAVALDHRAGRAIHDLAVMRGADDARRHRRSRAKCCRRNRAVVPHCRVPVTTILRPSCAGRFPRPERRRC